MYTSYIEAAQIEIKEMKLFNVKKVSTEVWIICEGEQTEGCAGEWTTEEEAEGVAKLLNECADEVS